uniref:Uncharacterized protein n=1 Tax=Chlamydomonas leiostraca TaxID=1034604 RepID=A0A7S0RYR2_9CHLO
MNVQWSGAHGRAWTSLSFPVALLSRAAPAPGNSSSAPLAMQQADLPAPTRPPISVPHSLLHSQPHSLGAWYLPLPHLPSTNFHVSCFHYYVPAHLPVPLGLSCQAMPPKSHAELHATAWILASATTSEGA